MKKLFAILFLLCCVGCGDNISTDGAKEVLDYDSVIESENSIVVSILVDSSGSMNEKNKWQSVKEVLVKLSDVLDGYQSKHNNVYVILYTFRTKTEIFLYDRERFLREIGGLPNPNGNTPLGEVTEYICDNMPQKGKKHLFILTDGEENGNVPIERVLQSNEGKASVYFVAFDFNKKNYERLGKHAKMFQADNKDELDAVVFEVFTKNILVEKEDDE